MSVSTKVSIHDYSESQYVTKAELAKIFDVTERTILRMVNRYELPKPVRMGKRSLWQIGYVRGWMEKRGARQMELTTTEMKRLKLED